MPKIKINQHREYARKILSSRLEIVRALHDDSLFYETDLGKALVDLKNLYHDIKQNDPIYHIKKASKHKLVKDKLDEITPLVEEVAFINKVASAIRKEDHTCKHFSHFMENFTDYLKHIGEAENISIKLKQHESLLRTIYHKEELKHLHENIHKDDTTGSLIKEFGHDRAGSTIYHHLKDSLQEHSLFERTKSLVIKPKSREERLEEVSKVLEKRANWLQFIAKFDSRMIIRSKIKEIEKKRKYWQKKSMKLLSKGEEHHKDLDELYKVFTDEK